MVLAPSLFRPAEPIESARDRRNPLSNVRALLVPATVTFVLGLAASFAAEPVAGRQNISSLPDSIDPIRARELYVSDRWEDHPAADYARDIAEKALTDSIYRAVAKGVLDFQMITYRSRAGDMDIPAYVFQPLKKRGPSGHPSW